MIPLFAVLGTMPIPSLQQPVPQAERMVSYLVSEASQRSQVTILADSTAADLRVVPPPGPGTDPATVEPWLDALVQHLPEGASWAKLYLPPPPKGKRWTGDQLYRLADALAALYGKVGAVEEGKAEILAQQVTNTEAAPIQKTLGLKPYYLVTLRGARTFAGRWEATFGELTLVVKGNRVEGTYTTNDGYLRGTLVGNRLNFEWFERQNNTRGTGYFVLADDGQSFSGQWGNNEEPQTSSWIGKRIVPR